MSLTKNPAGGDYKPDWVVNLRQRLESCGFVLFLTTHVQVSEMKNNHIFSLD